jgi:sugar lactone lactonase YvrE
VIYTEYDLPARTHQPHDVVVDQDGFEVCPSAIRARQDRSAERQGHAYRRRFRIRDSPFGTNDLAFDEDGNLWLATMFQAALIRFDRKPEKFTVFNSYPPPPEGLHREFTFTSPQHSKVDGKVWANDSATWTQWRLDIATGTWEVFELFPLPRTNTSQIFSDAQNNLYVNNMGRAHIGRIDAKTGKAQLWQTPTPNSGPRRGMLDDKGRLWYAGNRGNVVGMFDTRTSNREWVPPNPRYFPTRSLSIRTTISGPRPSSPTACCGSIRERASSSSIRCPVHQWAVWVDDRTTPVAFWVGGNHSASVVKVEALDTPPSLASGSAERDSRSEVRLEVLGPRDKGLELSNLRTLSHRYLASMCRSLGWLVCALIPDGSRRRQSHSILISR